MHSTKETAQLVLRALQESSVNHIVISPGSRNAPLVIEALNYPSIKLHSIIDERSAGFVALGIAQSENTPVALFCTSGSALLNYAPALAEAYYMKIPLIVVSADRPENLIEMADGQTIKQNGALNNVVKSSFILNSTVNAKNKTTQQQVFCFVNQANTAPKGPIHLNIHFDEPLYEHTENQISFHSFNCAPNSNKTIEKQPNEIEQILIANQKILLLIGQGNLSNEEVNLLKEIAEKNVAAVFYETTSNLGKIDGIFAIDIFLEGLTPKQKVDFSPELLISYKTNIISKKVKVWLRNSNISNHIHIGDEHLLLDTYQKLTHQKSGELTKCISNKNIKSNTGFVKTLKSEFSRIFQISENYTPPYSDFWVFKYLAKNIPTDSLLIIGNSAPIRYVQLFKEYHHFINFCNRGTSGIEGTISTAVGHCIANPEKNVFVIVGDISFFYDSNAFFNANLPRNLKVILINNNGGGIFRIIEGPKKVKNFETLIETNHTFNAEGLASTYGLSYFKASNEMEVKNALKDFVSNQNSAIFEIFTPRKKNDEVLKGFFSTLKF